MDCPQQIASSRFLHIVFFLSVLFFVMLLPVADYQRYSIIYDCFWGSQYSIYTRKTLLIIRLLNSCLILAFILFALVPFFQKKAILFSIAVLFLCAGLALYGFWDYRYMCYTVQMLLLLVVLASWGYLIVKEKARL